eukprot:jgi/Chlat1/9011/Chrsp94S08289
MMATVVGGIGMRASGEDDGAVSLAALFERAKATHDRMEAGDHDAATAGAREAWQEEVRGTCEGLERCGRMIDSLGLFSRNEEVDDVTTPVLKYFLVPYYLGSLLPQLTVDERRPVLHFSITQLQGFLHLIERYGLLPPETRAAATRRQPADATTRRAEKVARFKAEKESRAKVEAVQARLKYQKARAKSMNEGGEDFDMEDTEEQERELWLVLIQHAAFQALELVESYRQEEQLLAQAETLRGQGGEVVRQSLREKQNEAERRHREAAAAAEMEKRFGIAPEVQRERMSKQVFCNRHSTPTMSIEAFAEKEFERAQELERKTAQAAARQKAREDKILEGVDESEVYKQRAMDEFKDDNRRGSGNSATKPLR